MEYCPNCNTFMRWYMRYNCGLPVMGYHCDNCGYDTNHIENVASASVGALPMSNYIMTSDRSRFSEANPSYVTSKKALEDYISMTAQDILNSPLSLCLNVVVTTRHKQNRTHKRPRVNKKWAKRFGFTDVEVQDVPIVMGNTVYMTKKDYDELRKEVNHE